MIDLWWAWWFALGFLVGSVVMLLAHFYVLGFGAKHRGWK